LAAESTGIDVLGTGLTLKGKGHRTSQKNGVLYPILNAGVFASTIGKFLIVLGIKPDVSMEMTRLDLAYMANGAPINLECLGE